jgi:hypothetical protein
VITNGGIRKRLEELEEQTFGADPFSDFPDWDLADQLEAVAHVLSWYGGFHADGRVLYSATDREIHLLALLCAMWELEGSGRVGEHAFPSGLLVSFRDEGNGWVCVSASRRALLEDLPDDVRGHFERMDAAKQAERERFLYGHRELFKENRERMRRWKLHGEEKMRKRKEEHKRRDLEFLERNRVACGLPPLTPERIERWGLASTESPAKPPSEHRGEGGR